MKIYISGAISGVPNFREHFQRAADLLNAQGHQVVNPALLKLHAQATWQDYMKRCVVLLCPCDAIHMLPGWESSRGAKEERRIAKMLGIPVQYADERSAVVFPKVEV
jgi:hypothetical protein